MHFTKSVPSLKLRDLIVHNVNRENVIWEVEWETTEMLHIFKPL